jgi:hypothetical protein
MMHSLLTVVIFFTCTNAVQMLTVFGIGDIYCMYFTEEGNTVYIRKVMFGEKNVYLTIIAPMKK